MVTTDTRLHSVQPSLGWVVAILLDVLVLVMLAAVALIILTGGGIFHVGAATVRARSVENPLWVVTGLILLRYWLRRWPLLAVKRWPADGMLAVARRAVCAWSSGIASGFVRKPLLSIGCLSLAVLAVRLLLASQYPGFFSGDDVEIHEMTLGALLHQPWPVWDLRCAFFPMLVVYPAQRLAAALGVASPQNLVLSGRAAVALFSTATIPLIWWTARRVSPDDSRLAAVAALMLAANKLQMSFGSSELPRPVSTVFVLVAFVYLIRGRVLPSALAGVLLGIAIAFRFSEVVFVPVALLTVARRNVMAGSALLLAAGLTAAAAIGVADAIYWEQPFHSLLAAVDYTLVRGQSSRGYEPFWEYLRIIPSWSTWMLVALAAAGSSWRTPETWWLWTPIALLSFLPHKESRYLLPVIPFLCLVAARGFLRVAEWLQRASDVTGWRRWGRDLFAPMFVLAVLHDAGGWRLPRSNEGIRLAEYLRQTGKVGLAAQDGWRLGGRPYLSALEPVVEVSPELLSDAAAFATIVKDVRWVALRSRVARTAGDPVLRAVGFERDPAWHGEDYVLYVRRR